MPCNIVVGEENNATLCRMTKCTVFAIAHNLGRRGKSTAGWRRTNTEFYTHTHTHTHTIYIGPSDRFCNRFRMVFYCFNTEHVGRISYDTDNCVPHDVIISNYTY